MTKLTAAQIRANKKWDANNKARRTYTSHRSRAIRFIENDAYQSQKDYLSDLKDLQAKISAKIAELEKN